MTFPRTDRPGGYEPRKPAKPTPFIRSWQFCLAVVFWIIVIGATTVSAHKAVLNINHATINTPEVW